MVQYLWLILDEVNKWAAIAIRWVSNAIICVSQQLYIATAQPTNSATVHIYKSAMLWEEHTSPTEASDMQDDI